VEENKAMDLGRQMSQTTHQSLETADCCAFMMLFIMRALSRTSNDFSTGKSFLTELDDSSAFVPQTGTTADIAASRRDFDWKSDVFRYKPGNVGTYACDALAMALHCIWTTEAFDQAVLKAVNLGGDADALGAVTGQLAGAVYGYRSLPSDWLAKVRRWAPHRSLEKRCYYLSRQSASGERWSGASYATHFDSLIAQETPLKLSTANQK
jgi:ADP-ribosylglycohydrolase